MLGNTLRILRESRQLKQKDVAKAIFVSPSAISQYENGVVRPGRENLEALAKFFNVSTDYLLGASPNAELEDLMNSVYCRDITVAELLKMCLDLPSTSRETLLQVIDLGLAARGRRG